MIVYCCADLIFATKVRSTAEALGVVSRPVRDADMLAKRLDQIDDGKPNDPVTTVFLDLEAGDHTLAMIEQAKAHDAVPRVVVFAGHLLTGLLTDAQRRGADAALTRGAFSARLPELITASA